MPSAARIDIAGLAFRAYNPSTQWAIAFIPEGPETSGGSDVVSSGS
jgi:hypothetical protein